jgi:transcriptional regulator with XRE-family HTH domain
MIVRLTPDGTSRRAARFMERFRDAHLDARGFRLVSIKGVERLWGASYSDFLKFQSSLKGDATSWLRSASALGVHPSAYSRVVEELEWLARFPDLVPERMRVLAEEFVDPSDVIARAARGHVRRVARLLTQTASDARISHAVIAERIKGFGVGDAASPKVIAGRIKGFSGESSDEADEFTVATQQSVWKTLNLDGGGTFLRILEIGEALAFPSESIFALPDRLRVLSTLSPADLQEGLVRDLDELSVRRALYAARLAAASPETALDLQDVLASGSVAADAEQQLLEYGLATPDGDVRPVAAVALLLVPPGRTKLPTGLIEAAHDVLAEHASSVRARARNRVVLPDEAERLVAAQVETFDEQEFRSLSIDIRVALGKLIPEAGFAQPQIAQRLGINQANVSKLVNLASRIDPSPARLMRLGMVLGIEPEHLLELPEVMSRNLVIPSMLFDSSGLDRGTHLGPVRHVARLVMLSPKFLAAARAVTETSGNEVNHVAWKWAGFAVPLEGPALRQVIEAGLEVVQASGFELPPAVEDDESMRAEPLVDHYAEWRDDDFVFEIAFGAELFRETEHQSHYDALPLIGDLHL